MQLLARLIGSPLAGLGGEKEAIAIPREPRRHAHFGFAVARRDVDVVDVMPEQHLERPIGYVLRDRPQRGATKNDASARVASAAKLHTRQRHAARLHPREALPAWCKRWGWSADELTQAAGVVDRWRAVVFNGVVVEVAVAVDAIGPPGADPLGPWTQLGVGEGDAVITAVEADIGPVGGPLDVERNLPADGQAQSGVPRAQQLVHVRA